MTACTPGTAANSRGGWESSRPLGSSVTPRSRSAARSVGASRSQGITSGAIVFNVPGREAQLAAHRRASSTSSCTDTPSQDYGDTHARRSGWTPHGSTTKGRSCSGCDAEALFAATCRGLNVTTLVPAHPVTRFSKCCLRLAGRRLTLRPQRRRRRRSTKSRARPARTRAAATAPAIAPAGGPPPLLDVAPRRP